MKRLWILLLGLALQGPAVGELSAATFAYSEVWSGVPTQNIIEGGCVLMSYELIVLDLTEPLKAVEFSISLPPGVDISYGITSPGEVVREGDNFYINFDECIQPGEWIRLFVFDPIYEPVITGESCLGPAIPSRLGLTEAGYLSCDGDAVAFETWADPRTGIPQGCAMMFLDRGGPAEECAWGAVKSWF